MVCPFHGLHRTKVRHVSSGREHVPTPLNHTRLPYMHCQCWQHFSPDGILLLLVSDIVFAMHVDVPSALNCTVLDSRQQCLLALRLVPLIRDYLHTVVSHTCRHDAHGDPFTSHLVVPGGGAERSAMAEDDGRPRAPVLVRDLRAV